MLSKEWSREEPGSGIRKKDAASYGPDGIFVSDTCNYIAELVRMVEDDKDLPEHAVDDLLERRANPENKAVSERMAPYYHRIVHHEYRLIALRAVGRDGMFVENYPGLWGDREVMAAACRQNPEALQFASDELKNDEQFILPILTRGADAIYHCSLRLQRKYGSLRGV